MGEECGHEITCCSKASTKGVWHRTPFVHSTPAANCRAGLRLTLILHAARSDVGLLLTLSKRKQVCNHPPPFLGDNSAIPDRSVNRLATNGPRCYSSNRFFCLSLRIVHPPILYELSLGTPKGITGEEGGDGLSTGNNSRHSWPLPA